jgi:2-polyprenyl-3-methyl-5-hydroxy-6-metoxy-1,4-benzoquinol methylase
MDGSNLGFRSEFFDVVFSLEVIEHVEDFQGFVEESHRVLRSGGTYIVSTPNKGESQKYTSCPFHLREFTKHEVYLLLSKKFENILFFGKRVKNEKFLNQQEALSGRVTNKMISLVLTHIPSARFTAKYLHRNVKKLITGHPTVNLTIDDFEITPDTEHASCLIAVAKKIQDEHQNE